MWLSVFVLLLEDPHSSSQTKQAHSLPSPDPSQTQLHGSCQSKDTRALILSTDFADAVARLS